MTPNKQILIQYLTSIKDDYITESASKDLIASGKTVKSLRVVGMQLRGNDLTWVAEGRGPGGMPPLQDIAKWMKSRFMKGSPYFIAKYIAENGTRIYNQPSLGLSIHTIIKSNLTGLRGNLRKNMHANILEAIKAFN